MKVKVEVHDGANTFVSWEALPGTIFVRLHRLQAVEPCDFFIHQTKLTYTTVGRFERPNREIDQDICGRVFASFPGNLAVTIRAALMARSGGGALAAVETAFEAQEVKPPTRRCAGNVIGAVPKAPVAKQQRRNAVFR